MSDDGTYSQLVSEAGRLLNLEPTPSDMPAQADPPVYVDPGPEEPWLIQGKRDLQRHFECRQL